MDYPQRQLRGGRRRGRRPWAAVLVAAAMTFAWTASTGVAAAGPPHRKIRPAYDVPTAAANGMKTLMEFYDSSTGLIGTSWWQSAVALSTLMTYAEATGDNQYDFAIAAAFKQTENPNFENNLMDDTGWWGVAWLQAYNMIGNAQYLQMAETDANYIHQRGWDDTCGGGLWWETGHQPYKNAIPNELFLELTAGLHNAIPGDTKYLGWANAEWSWFRNQSGLIGTNGMVIDKLTTPTTTNPFCEPTGPSFTYNQGVILAGLTQLSIATGNSSLLTAAQGIANVAILNLGINGSGVLDEDGTACGTDIQSFKGTFARGLKDLSNALQTESYASFFENQVNSIIPNDTNSADQLGFQWQGPVSTPGCPFNGITSYSQASAEDALVAGLSLGHNGTALAGIAGYCLDDNGSGTTSGNEIDVWGCNSSPAQSWSTPAPGDTGEMRVLGGCATVNGSKNKGTTVVWDPCTGSAQQEWTRHTGSGSILLNAWSGLCMDNKGNTAVNGNPVQIYTCNNTQAQFWDLP